MTDIPEGPFYVALGCILRERRKAARLTIADLARASSVNYTTIWRVEHGRPETMRSVIRIANKLAFEPAALLRQATEEAKREVLAA